MSIHIYTETISIGVQANPQQATVAQLVALDATGNKTGAMIELTRDAARVLAGRLNALVGLYA